MDESIQPVENGHLTPLNINTSTSKSRSQSPRRRFSCSPFPFGSPLLNSTRSILNPGSLSPSFSEFGRGCYSLPVSPAAARLRGRDVYGGTVVYGGKSTSRRSRLLAAAPYQNVTNRRHLQDHQCGDVISKASSQHVSSGISSTARTILESLEKMSTPVKDAQKIPALNPDPSTPQARAEKRRLIAAELAKSLDGYEPKPGSGSLRRRPRLASTKNNHGLHINGPPTRSILFSPLAADPKSKDFVKVHTSLTEEKSKNTVCDNKRLSILRDDSADAQQASSNTCRNVNVTFSLPVTTSCSFPPPPNVQQTTALALSNTSLSYTRLTLPAFSFASPREMIIGRQNMSHSSPVVKYEFSAPNLINGIVQKAFNFPTAHCDKTKSDLIKATKKTARVNDGNGDCLPAITNQSRVLKSSGSVMDILGKQHNSQEVNTPAVDSNFCDSTWNPKHKFGSEWT